MTQDSRPLEALEALQARVVACPSFQRVLHAVGPAGRPSARPGRPLAVMVSSASSTERTSRCPRVLWLAVVQAGPAGPAGPRPAARCGARCGALCWWCWSWSGLVLQNEAPPRGEVARSSDPIPLDIFCRKSSAPLQGTRQGPQEAPGGPTALRKEAGGPALPGRQPGTLQGP